MSVQTKSTPASRSASSKAAFRASRSIRATTSVALWIRHAASAFRGSDRSVVGRSHLDEFTDDVAPLRAEVLGERALLGFGAPGRLLPAVGWGRARRSRIADGILLPQSEGRQGVGAVAHLDVSTFGAEPTYMALSRPDPADSSPAVGGANSCLS